jgi:hypothetical protein
MNLTSSKKRTYKVKQVHKRFNRLLSRKSRVKKVYFPFTSWNLEGSLISIVRPIFGERAKVDFQAREANHWPNQVPNG